MVIHGTSIVEFRHRTLLPLDDVMCCFQEAIPKLSRSALHRCLRIVAADEIARRALGFGCLGPTLTAASRLYR